VVALALCNTVALILSYLGDALGQLVA